MAVDVSMWSSEAWTSAADMYLLARTREGSDEAFAELWRRHLPAAYAVANRYRDHGHAEDIVAEAAARVLALLKEGKGPDENFRSYFLSAVRSVAVDSGRRELKVVPTPHDDLDALMGPVVDAAEDDGFDPDLVREAFHRLPERDQRVLWHTTVEGQAPRLVGPVLGMSANAVSVRARRAREALRASYLEAHAAAHLRSAETAECRWAVGVLVAHVRDRLPKRATDRLDAHLAGCEHETALLSELRTLHDRFPALVVPLIFLAGVGTPGFLGGSVFAAAAAGASVGAAGAAPGAAGAAPGAAGATPDVAGATADGTGAAGMGVAGSAGPAAEAGQAAITPGPTQPDTAGPTGPDVVSGLGTKAAAVAAAAVIAAGVLGAAGSSDVPSVARPATSSSSASSSAASSSAPPLTSSTVATIAEIATTTSATTTTQSTTTSPTTTTPTSSAARVAQQPAPSGTHSVELRIISSGTPTRFSLRFDSPTSGILRIWVGNVSGRGRLSVDNDAFACSNTSRSSVACTGRTGQMMLTQSGLARPEAVVVRVTDRKGATSTRTLSLG